MVAWLQTKPDIDKIVMVSAWSGYLLSIFEEEPSESNLETGSKLIALGLNKTLDRISPSYPVHIISDFPRPERSLISCLMGGEGIILRKLPEDCHGLDRAKTEAWHAPSTSALNRVAASRENVWSHDLVELLCGDTVCATYIEDRLLYMDSNHIRRNLTNRELDVIVKKMKLEERVLYGVE